MEILLRFLQKNEIWSYALLSIIGFFYLQKLVQAWSEWRLAVFGLEREAAQRKLSTSITILALLALIGISQFVLISFVLPVYPWSGSLPTPTLDLLATPSATVGPSLTPPPPGTVPQTPVPTAVSSSTDGCIPGTVEWTYPQPDEEISGIIELKGIVNIPDLGFYKYEYSQVSPENWFTIAAGNQIRNNEPLGGAWNTEQLTPGDYLLRLVVARNNNEVMPPCIIPVKITIP